MSSKKVLKWKPDTTSLKTLFPRNLTKKEHEEIMKNSWAASPKVEKDPHGKDQHEPGAKVDAGKQLAGVLMDFSRALTEVAEVGSRGARKYTRGGWKQVPDGVQRYTDAFWRHLLAIGRGEPIDSDLGTRHWAQVAWNVLALLELTIRGEEEARKAGVAAVALIRQRMTEEGMLRKVMPPAPIADDEFDRQIGMDKPVRILDKDPTKKRKKKVVWKALWKFPIRRRRQLHADVTGELARQVKAEITGKLDAQVLKELKSRKSRAKKKKS